MRITKTLKLRGKKDSSPATLTLINDEIEKFVSENVYFYSMTKKGYIYGHSTKQFQFAGAERDLLRQSNGVFTLYTDCESATSTMPTLELLLSLYDVLSVMTVTNEETNNFKIEECHV